MKVWQRRFMTRENIPLLESFNASIEKDKFLYDAEIKGSLTYAQALKSALILSDDEFNSIELGLKKVKERIESGEDLSVFEDIHSAVELLLIDEIGETGKKLHTGRSRNEQVVCDERLWLKEKVPELINLLIEIQKTTISLAKEHIEVVMPGFTHLQQGQCVLFSHYIMSLFWQMERGKERLKGALNRINYLTLGSGALAGSTVSLDRNYMKELLGFDMISENSMDSVSDRSFILETLFTLALITQDLSRMAEDFIIFASLEFGYIKLDDTISTSSSLMPQKKNPDFFELLRPAPAKLFGYVTQLFITIKGIPSTYNKDLQEDKEPLFKGVVESIAILKVFNLTLARIRPNKEKIETHLDSFLLATDLADYLSEKGVPFREAHGIIGAIVNYAEKSNKILTELTLSELKKFNKVFEEDVFTLFDFKSSVKKKKTYGSTNPDYVSKQIEKAEKLIDS